MTKENKELEEKYYMLQMLMQENKELREQLEAVQNQLASMIALKMNLADIKNTNSNTASYSRLGPGIFVESEIKDTKLVLVTVGANVVVRKSVDEAQKLIDKQVFILQDHTLQLNKFLQAQSNKASQLEAEVEELAKKK